MTQIDLDDGTARDLLAAASASGMSVEAFVRARLIVSKDVKISDAAEPLSIIGCLANEADLLDAVVEDAMAARERDPFRTPRDG